MMYTNRTIPNIKTNAHIKKKQKLNIVDKTVIYIFQCLPKIIKKSTQSKQI